ncbi:hypothetical protein NCC49_006405 [Naganishia albida]|nr:hypothetical protein NCC49_006405 [Naganishia albida]
MPREIISLSAGNQLGVAFWENILQEHGLDKSGKYTGTEAQAHVQLDRLSVYFDEVANKKYVPRSIQVDLEPAVLDNVKSGGMGNLFRPDTFVNAQGGAGNNWAKGYYTEGAELIDPILDIARGQAERSDSLQGFQVLHSLGGGTGSGLGALLLSKIREEYPDRMLCDFAIFPSPKVSDTVVEPYNALLSAHNLVENTDISVCLDNEALYDICQNTLKIKQPEYEQLNGLIAKVMSGFTTTLRFPGVLNSDLRKLAVNMIPFPRLHFFSVGYAPLSSTQSRAYQQVNVQELTQSLFDKRSWLAAVDPAMGKYLTASIAYRGKLGTRDIESAVNDYQDKHSASFVPWIPDHVQTTSCSVPAVGGAASATLVANSTSIAELFKRNHSQFVSMFRRKAFLHWYTGEGMDELEFTEAESNLADLVSEYEQYANAELDDEEMYGDHMEEEGQSYAEEQ